MRERKRKTRRDSRIRAVEDALFEMGSGSAAQVAEKVGCSRSTAYRHLNGLITDKLVGWSRLFLPGRRGYIGSARSYALTSRGREVIGAMHLLRDDVDYLLSEGEVPHPEEFEGLDTLIWIHSSRESIQEVGRRSL